MEEKKSKQKIGEGEKKIVGEVKKEEEQKI